MIPAMPNLLSFRVKYPARSSTTIVTGIATIVKANSMSVFCTTMTTNWMVKPRKKKKSNFRRAI